MKINISKLEAGEIAGAEVLRIAQRVLNRNEFISCTHWCGTKNRQITISIITRRDGHEIARVKIKLDDLVSELLEYCESFDNKDDVLKVLVNGLEKSLKRARAAQDTPRSASSV